MLLKLNLGSWLLASPLNCGTADRGFFGVVIERTMLSRLYHLDTFMACC